MKRVCRQQARSIPAILGSASRSRSTAGNPEVDRLLDQSEVTFDPAERDRLLAKVNEIVVDDAPWIFIVHDLNPRALSPKVKGFVQAQSWYQDLTLPWVEK
jgi:peptide/nickel transport system substrate-binding protein